MNSKFWLLIAAILSVGVLIMGWFLGVSPQLDAMNAAAEQKAAVDTQNVAFEKRIAELQEDEKNIDDWKEQLAEMQIALPPGDELSTFLGQLHALEEASGVQLNSFSPSSGLPFVPVANGTDAVASPLVTAENFIVIPVDLKVEGTRTQVLDFVEALQEGDRLFLVNSLTVQSGASSNEGYTGTLSGFVYVLVDPAAPPPAPSKEESTPTPSPSPSLG